MEVTSAFKLYWYLAAERQNIFFKRMRGEPGPWTNDPILQQFKFTNAYRASDRVSQYLIRNVIYDGLENVRSYEDTFFRIMLFKIFNLPETWEKYSVLKQPIVWSAYHVDEVDKILTACVQNGIRVNSNAYMMTGSGSKGQYRHKMYLGLLDQMMQDKVPLKIRLSKDMGEAFKIIRSYRCMGDFLAYQYITDINYSPMTDFSEMEFTVPGPGSLRGIQKCFKGIDLKVNTPEEIIGYMAVNQDVGFKKYGLTFKRIGDRPLQLIDIQNVFCELDKYTRMVPEFEEEGKRIKNTFEANPKPIEYFYPPKWKIDRWGFKVS